MKNFNFDILNKNEEYLLGLSAGSDSNTLLHYLVTAGYKITAIHVNHNIQKFSPFWENFARNYCVKLNVPFKSIHVTLPNTGNLEDNARQARYESFAKIAQGKKIIVAHHLNDNIETFILKLLRGAGVSSLKGMSPVQTLKTKNGDVTILRPMLDVTKFDVRVYAKINKISWASDPSNGNLDFNRNFIRYDILIRLIDRWGDKFINSFLHTIRLLREADTCLDDLGKIDYDNTKNGVGLDIMKLATLSNERKSNLIRYLLKEFEIYKFSGGQLRELLKVLNNLENNLDRQFSFHFGNLNFHKFETSILLIKKTF